MNTNTNLKKTKKGSLVEIKLNPQPLGVFPNGIMVIIDTREEASDYQKELEAVAKKYKFEKGNFSIVEAYSKISIEHINSFIRELIGTKNIIIRIPYNEKDETKLKIAKHNLLKEIMLEVTLFLLRDSLNIDMLAGKNTLSEIELSGMKPDGEISESSFEETVTGAVKESYKANYNSLCFGSAETEIEREIKYKGE